MRKQVLIRLVITWGWSSSLHRACWSLYLFASYQPAWTFVFRFTMRLLYYCSVNWVSASSLLMVFPSITMGFSSSSPSSAYEVDASKTDISFTITFCNWNRWFRRKCSWLSHLHCSGVLCSISIHTLGFFRFSLASCASDSFILMCLHILFSNSTKTLCLCASTFFCPDVFVSWHLKVSYNRCLTVCYDDLHRLVLKFQNLPLSSMHCHSNPFWMLVFISYRLYE